MAVPGGNVSKECSAYAGGNVASPPCSDRTAAGTGYAGGNAPPADAAAARYPGGKVNPSSAPGWAACAWGLGVRLGRSGHSGSSACPSSKAFCQRRAVGTSKQRSTTSPTASGTPST